MHGPADEGGDDLVVMLIGVVGFLIGFFYFGMVVMIRPMTAEMEAQNAAFREFVRDFKLGSETSEDVSGYFSRLDEQELDALHAEFKDRAEYQSEVATQLRNRIYPKRVLLWPVVLISYVVASTIVISIGAKQNESESVWEGLLIVSSVLVIPWFISTGSVDVADRLWRRSHVGRRAA